MSACSGHITLKRYLFQIFCAHIARKGDSAKEMNIGNENDQADRIISTGKLHALRHFHTQPINVVVFHDPDREN